MVQEILNVLRIFKEGKEAIQQENYSKLRELSNQTINTASRTHDPDNIATAVVVYSLSKILERSDYRKQPGWQNFYKKLIAGIDKIIEGLEKNNEESFKENLEKLRDSVNKLSGKLKIYIQDVFRKASINKASRIYEHGISMEKTAKLLGISLWELADYAGKSVTADTSENKTFDVKERIKLAMEMFE